MNEDYISNQIAVYKNNKILLEISDKLKVANLSYYAHIHAASEDGEDGRRRTSLIGILMKDYSKGTGDKAVTVKCNISPDEIKFILTRLTAGFSEYEYTQDKIFGAKDKDGFSQVTKLRIIRASKDPKGTPRNLPWYFEIENGKAIPQNNANGGTYIAPKTYVAGNKVFANLSDLDTFRLLNRVCSFIDAWEKAVAPSLIKTAKVEITRRLESKNAA